jgi:GrpB-like predicted nucleotidyltransferase (UPF0157 family)
MDDAEKAQLAAMPLAELWQLFPIELSPPRPEWATWYADQAERLQQQLGDAIWRLSHIGSTAVPGLVAKPIVDLLLEITPTADPAQVVATLDRDDWLVMSETTDPQLRISLNKGYTAQGFADRVFHLHLIRADDPDELYFRDWLRDHPADQATYVALKTPLAATYRHDRDAYTDAKTTFVTTLTAQSRATYGPRYASGTHA